MNGDLGKIYDLIGEVKKDVAVIEERQRNNHEENKSKLEKVDNLPCDAHIEKFKAYDTHIEDGKKWRLAIIILVIGLVTSLVQGAMAFGELKAQVKDHIEYTTNESTP